jgi:hypothetical protein
MSFDYISNHVERGLERILEQFKNKAKIKGLISAFIKPLQGAEDTLNDMVTKRNLDDAEGVQLDLIGTIVGLERTFQQSDDDYRDDLRQQIYLNLYSGTPDQIMRAAAYFIGTTDLFYTENYPAEVDVQSEMVLTEEQAAYIREKIKSFLPAGVSLGIVGQYDDDSFLFYNDNDPESVAGVEWGQQHGFGDVDGEVLKVWNAGRIIDNDVAEFEKRGLFGFTRGAKNPVYPYYATLNHWTNKIQFLKIENGNVSTVRKNFNINSFHYRGSLEYNGKDKAASDWTKTHCSVSTDVIAQPGEDILAGTGDLINAIQANGISPSIKQAISTVSLWPGDQKDYFAFFYVKKKEARYIRLFVQTDASPLNNKVWVDVDLKERKCSGPRYNVNYDMPFQVGVHCEDVYLDSTWQQTKDNGWLKITIGVNLTMFTPATPSISFGMDILGPNGEAVFDNNGPWGVYVGEFSFSFLAYTRGRAIKWSPDGKQIAIAKDMDNGAMVAHPIGLYTAKPYENGEGLYVGYGTPVFGNDYSWSYSYPNIHTAVCFINNRMVITASDGTDANVSGQIAHVWEAINDGWSMGWVECGPLITGVNDTAWCVEANQQVGRSYPTIVMGLSSGALRVGKVNNSVPGSPSFVAATDVSTNTTPTDDVKGCVWLPDGNAFIVHTKSEGLFYYDYDYDNNEFAVRASLPSGMPSLNYGAPITEMTCDPINKSISYIWGEQFNNDFFTVSGGLMTFNDDYSEWEDVTGNLPTPPEGVLWPGLSSGGHPFLDDANHITLIAGNGVSYSSGVIVTNGNRMYSTYIERGEDDQTYMTDGPGLSEQY